jgi:hypothetical protein
MDYNRIYENQIKFYNHLQERFNNPTVLTDEVSPAKNIAEHLFKKRECDLINNKIGLICDIESFADMFDFCIELLLYGFDILSGGKSIFDVTDSTDDILYKIKRYLHSSGIIMTIHEIVVDISDLNIFHTKSEYYCVIKGQTPITYSNWSILNYDVFHNSRFVLDDDTKMEDMIAYYISNKRTVITFKFSQIL